MCEQELWIMDGNYSKTIPLRVNYASSIIYLDTPRWKCLLRTFLRRFRFIYNKTRDDIPADCKERVSLDFYKWIWDYPKRSRKQALKTLEEFTGPAYHLKSKADVEKLFSEIINSELK